MVDKVNRKWKICINYTDLNKVYPKSFSLSKIDQLVDMMSGHTLLSFIDAFSSHQPDSKPKSFIDMDNKYTPLLVPRVKILVEIEDE